MKRIIRQKPVCQGKLLINLWQLLTLLAAMIACTGTAFSDENALNIYNWSNYLPNSVITQFQQETGIHVNYSEYDSSEMLYARLKTSPRLDFDIIVPSSYYIPRMAREDMLHRLDHKKIPNMRYMNPMLMHRHYDPDNAYSLPYTFGITGIAVNRKYHQPTQVNTWQDLWDKRYRNQLLMLDDMREVFSIALIALNYSVNDTNPAHIERACKKLQELLPNIKLFNSGAAQNAYTDADVTLGMAWNGDIFQVQQENPNVAFVYPKGRFVLWIDTIAIPKHAPHLENAYRFLDFINRPDVAAEIADYNGYSSPNLAAQQQMPAELRNNPVFNPPAAMLKHAVMEHDPGAAANRQYEACWQRLKLGA